MKNNRLRKLTILLIILVIVLSFTGCIDNKDAPQQKRISELGGLKGIMALQVQGDKYNAVGFSSQAYYIVNGRITDDTITLTPLAIEYEKDYRGEVLAATMDSKNIYVIHRVYKYKYESEGKDLNEYEEKIFIRTFDYKGSVLKSVDISDKVMQEANPILQMNIHKSPVKMLLDSKGMIYVVYDQGVIIFNKDLKLQKTYEFDDMTVENAVSVQKDSVKVLATHSLGWWQIDVTADNISKTDFLMQPENDGFFHLKYFYPSLTKGELSCYNENGVFDYDSATGKFNFNFNWIDEDSSSMYAYYKNFTQLEDNGLLFTVTQTNEMGGVTGIRLVTYTQ